jgi:SPP1 gp7 family putative phage head morphogenesis protein
MDHTSSNLSLADDDESVSMHTLPFDDAVSFLKSRISFQKKEWKDFEPKLRFRAFTMAKLAQCDFIEAARGRLITAMEKGEGFAESWKDIKAIAEEDGSNIEPGYWENVFRTNTQTCYNAGRLLEFRKNPPDSIALIVLDDERTSPICKPLIGLVLPYSHSFWKSYWPPFHFQCRTTVRGIDKSEIGRIVHIENVPMKKLRKMFKPQEGFGSNPLEEGTFWKMPDNMAQRAYHYGVDQDIVEFGKKLGLDDVFKVQNIIKTHKYSFVKTGKKTGYYIAEERQPRSSNEMKIIEKEKAMAALLSEKNHEVYLIPDRRPGVKNVDTVIDGRFADLKQIEGKLKRVGERFRESRKQGNTVFIKIDQAFSVKSVRDEIKGEIKSMSDSSGLCICYFTKSKKYYYWDISKLKAENKYDPSYEGPSRPYAVLLPHTATISIDQTIQNVKPNK